MSDLVDYTELLPVEVAQRIINDAAPSQGDRWDMMAMMLAAVQAAAPAIRAAERERAAVLIQDYPHWIGEKAKSEIAAAIRALPEEP